MFCASRIGIQAVSIGICAMIDISADAASQTCEWGFGLHSYDAVALRGKVGYK